MKRTKVILITTIVIVFALIIGYFIRHSFALDEEETNITADCTNIICLDITFLKEDEDSGAPVNGAKFRLWGTSDNGDEVDMEATSQNGKVIFKDVPIGEYSLKEIESPKGYKLDTKTYTVEAGDRS